MVTHNTVREALLGRDVGVAYAIIGTLYLLKFVKFQPVQIPPYLLIVAYDFVEMVVPVLTPYHPIGFPLFLYFLAIVGAGATRWFRSDTEDGIAWHHTAGGICLVVGVMSISFGVFVGGPLITPADNPTPLAITGVTGLVFLGASWLLLGRPSQ